MGLLCGHELARWHEQGVPVPLSAIHQHWRFNDEAADENEDDVPMVLDPLPPRRTRRGQGQHEYVIQPNILS